ncbi:hypothetical protein V6N13_015177 [Hibiscus sabdariffa]|uniref:Uncharacterized protein n=2 Tax=Hibiscus sabdariffa TaxID=183260 RepID=A0ABR2B7V2_9ROSI
MLIRSLRIVERFWVVNEAHLEVLNRSIVDWFRRAFQIHDLVGKLSQVKWKCFHLMRLVGYRVLLICDSVEDHRTFGEWSPYSEEINRRCWLLISGIQSRRGHKVHLRGSFILTDDSMKESTSFERAQVLVETIWLKSIDEIMGLVKGVVCKSRSKLRDMNRCKLRKMIIMLSFGNMMLSRRGMFDQETRSCDSK